MAADATTPLPPPPPAPDALAPTAAPTVTLVRPPQAGELTLRWRIVTASMWILVGAAFVAVWRVSDQLGLTTWWIGPRGAPNSRVVQVVPFVPAVIMLLLSINRVRHVAWFGLAAAAAIIAIGVADFGHVFRLGLIEVLIGAAAAVVSMASLSGTYRRRAG